METLINTPNLFIVGAPKCGSTSLYTYLSQHPAVYMSQLKEPRYWSKDLREEGKRFHNSWIRHTVTPFNLYKLPHFLREHKKTRPERRLGIEKLSDYLALFNNAQLHKHKYIGEASVDYIWSKTAANEIANFCPHAKIIILLREPISYMISIFREALSGKIGENISSITKALKLEPKRLKWRAVPCTARYPFSVCYKSQAHFDEQISRFSAVFPKKQLYFLLLEDLAVNTMGEINKLFKFLAISECAQELDLSPKNISTSIEPVDLSSEKINELKKEFAPIVSRLERQTGLILKKKWGYTSAQ